MRREDPASGRARMVSTQSSRRSMAQGSVRGERIQDLSRERGVRQCLAPSVPGRRKRHHIEAHPK